MTSEALLQQGRDFRKGGSIDEAIECFAKAVESKMTLLESEVSIELADYLIEYADALLTKEESNTTDFLGAFADRNGSVDGNDATEAGTLDRLDSARLDDGVPDDGDAEDESPSDIQLAWESFEHARLCLMSADCLDDTRRVQQLSFIHCRLGDIQALQEQFSDSIADYALSVEFAIKSNATPRKSAGLLVSLCQTIQAFIMSSEDYKAASVASPPKGSDDLLLNMDEKLRSVFQSIASTYSLSVPPESTTSQPRAKLIPILARDGFLLAHALLMKTANEDKGTLQEDIQSTMEEISSCANDCEVAQVGLLPPNHHQFAAPSTDNSSEVVVVQVKRKVNHDVISEGEPVEKLPKDNSRADKARVVD